RSIHRHQLSNVYHRGLAQPSLALSQANISRRSSQLEVGRYGGDYDCLDATLVKAIGLQNERRTPAARLGPGRTRQVEPQDITLRDHQRSSAPRRERSTASFVVRCSRSTL